MFAHAATSRKFQIRVKSSVMQAAVFHIPEDLYAKCALEANGWKKRNSRE